MLSRRGEASPAAPELEDDAARWEAPFVSVKNAHTPLDKHICCQSSCLTLFSPRAALFERLIVDSVVPW